MKAMLNVCKEKEKDSHSSAVCWVKLICCILVYKFNTEKNSQTKPTEWCSRETVSCLGTEENKIYTFYIDSIIYVPL